MSKPITALLIFVALIFAAVGTSVIVGRPAQSDSCDGVAGTSYMVTIRDSKVSAPDIKAKLCDKLMFMNEDKVTREIAFGPHENHVPYDGVAEKFLSQGQYFTITLNKAGSYHWHDHLHDEVEGYFNVGS